MIEILAQHPEPNVQYVIKVSELSKNAENEAPRHMPTFFLVTIHRLHLSLSNHPH